MKFKQIRVMALFVALIASLPAWGKGSEKVLEGLVNINTATAQELGLLPGIGPKMATAIIGARPYKTTDDLIRVKGIGPKSYEKMKGHLTVQGETTAKQVKRNDSSRPQASLTK